MLEARAAARLSGGTWRAAFAGLAGLLVGIGLSRFAYTPLIPALIGARWFTPAEAAYLGATNLAGYLVGALAARALGRRLAATAALRLAMLAATLSFVACAWPAGMAWFVPWRLLSGIAGGVLMVLGTTLVLAHTPAAQRGKVSGLIFSGVGFGITVSGTLVPSLVPHGLTVTWLSLGLAAGALTVASWRCWPSEAPCAPAAPAASGARLGALRPVLLLGLAYIGDAIGFIPHAVFWIDYIARGLGKGLSVGGWYWVAYGIGAVAGPPLAGFLADRVGLGRSLALGLAVKTMAVGLPLLCEAPLCLVLSSLVVGAFTPGVPALMSGRTVELLPREQLRPAWAVLTTTFALSQAAGAYGISYLFAARGSYHLLFAIGAASLSLATLAAALSARQKRRY
jgi:MFS family permease